MSHLYFSRNFPEKFKDSWGSLNPDVYPRNIGREPIGISFQVGAMAPLGFFDPAGFSKVGDKVWTVMSILGGGLRAPNS